MRKNLVLGLDIGGSGVKGAVVDVVKGEFVGDRIRIPTPSPHTPSNIISAICEIVDGFKWKGPIGFQDEERCEKLKICGVQIVKVLAEFITILFTPCTGVL